MQIYKVTYTHDQTTRVFEGHAALAAWLGLKPASLPPMFSINGGALTRFVPSPCGKHKLEATITKANKLKPGRMSRREFEASMLPPEEDKQPALRAAIKRQQDRLAKMALK